MSDRHRFKYPVLLIKGSQSIKITDNPSRLARDFLKLVNTEEITTSCSVTGKMSKQRTKT